MAAEIYARLGAGIRKRREALGLTQAQLATRINTGRTSIAMIERGGQALLVHQLLELANALHTVPNEILAEISVPTDAVGKNARPDRRLQHLLRGLDKSVDRITRG